MGFRLSLLREATEFSLTSKVFASSAAGKLALAAFIYYYVSGIRVTPLAASQTARGVELLRLAVPARRYLPGHMDEVAEAVQYIYARR